MPEELEDEIWSQMSRQIVPDQQYR
jgi:hypothetical protein